MPRHRSKRLTYKDQQTLPINSEIYTKRWYNSSEYQAIIHLRLKSVDGHAMLCDPFVYLDLLAGQTEQIALGVASIVLPLRHPAHVAKAAASVDALSGGRLILGVASGDRPEEYPALNIPFENRGERFRASFDYIRQMAEDAPAFENAFGAPYGGMDMLPKPVAGKLPLLITGGFQQSPDWLAENGTAG